jgi:CIC family chloride channel protein
VINYTVFTTWTIFYNDALHTPSLFFIFLFTCLALSYFITHLLAWYRTPKSSFHSILEVYHLSPTGMMPREAIVKTASGIVTAVLGGSAGPEGPATLITGGFSVWLSKVAKVRIESNKALMIGVAAGFSAAFKTPLTGILFALELPFRRDLEKDAFIEGTLASSTAYLVSVAIGAPSLLPGLKLDTAIIPSLVIPMSLIFGFATGSLVLVFTRLYKGAETIAKRLSEKGGYPLMLIVGGLVLGAAGYLSPEAMGPGYQMIPLLTTGSLITLIVLLITKPIVTSMSLTFGGGGGLFLPTLLIGGTWGAVIATIIAPEYLAIFILMGMASFSAGIHKMLLTPVIFVAEVFGSQTIIPVILATVIAYFVSGSMSFYPVQPLAKHSQEELALERFYHKVTRRKVKELEKLTAKNLMTEKPIRIKADMTVREAFNVFSRTPFRIMPVVNAQDSILGYVSLEDLALLTKTSLDQPLHESELKQPLLFKETTPVMKVIEEMITKEEDHCYVIDEKNRLSGVISTIDATRLLMRYYTQ